MNVQNPLSNFSHSIKKRRLLSQKALIQKILLFIDHSKSPINLKDFYSLNKNKRVQNYFIFQNPLNLLFSTDQFLYEFIKKIPQRKKISDFKIKLKERKKLKVFYGYLSNKQFLKIVEISKQLPGYFSKNLLVALESRLDVIIFRSNFTQNIIQARQLIFHGKIKVNNQVIKTSSYIIKSGDVISIQFKNIQDSVKIKPVLSTPDKLANTLLSNSFDIASKTNESLNQVPSKKEIFCFIKLLLNKISSKAHVDVLKVPYTVNTFNETFLSFYKIKRKNVSQPAASTHKFTTHYTDIFQKSIGFSKLNTETLSAEKYYYKQLFLDIIKQAQFPFISRKLLNLKLSKFLTKKANNKQILESFQFYGIKPLNLEISYKLLKIISLYSPQRIYYPFYLDIDALKN